jgi:hypothetical protein
LCQFFTFPLFSDSPTEVIGEGLFPVWKWVKPGGGVYSRKATWKAELGKVLEDGECYEGGDLTVLVSGVSEQARKVAAGGKPIWSLWDLRDG